MFKLLSPCRPSRTPLGSFNCLCMPLYSLETHDRPGRMASYHANQVCQHPLQGPTRDSHWPLKCLQGAPKRIFRNSKRDVLGRRSLKAIWALRNIGAFRPMRTIVAIGALRAITTFMPIRAFGQLKPSVPKRPLVQEKTFKAVRALRALGPLRLIEPMRAVGYRRGLQGPFKATVFV